MFVINIENKGFRATWGARSAAPYLAQTMRRKGVLLTQYFGTAHHSLPNYLAQISGQAPSHSTQLDCKDYTEFVSTAPTVSPGQEVGDGCVYPRSVETLAGQLSDAGLGWRGYMEDMARPCQHTTLGATDPWRFAKANDQYATKHNPFVYFRSITSRPKYCASHVVPLTKLGRDLQHVRTTRALTYITPDLCHDGHDATCAGGGPGGLKGVNAFLKAWAPKILQSPAFRADGMLVITADEAGGSSTACCGEVSGPNVGQAGIHGPGGGRIGALVLSPFTAPRTRTSVAYNHYSLLATIEDLFGLPRLGYASTSPHSFGADVFNAP